MLKNSPIATNSNKSLPKTLRSAQLEGLFSAWCQLGLAARVSLPQPQPGCPGETGHSTHLTSSLAGCSLTFRRRHLNKMPPLGRSPFTFFLCWQQTGGSGPEGLTVGCLLAARGELKGDSSTYSFGSEAVFCVCGSSF